MTPCNFDHNGDCLVCDCWPSDCAYQRLINQDYSWETKEQLEAMFKSYSIKQNQPDMTTDNTQGPKAIKAFQTLDQYLEDMGGLTDKQYHWAKIAMEDFAKTPVLLLQKFISQHETGILPNRFLYEEVKAY